MAKVSNKLVVRLFEVLKEKKLSVPRFSEETGIPSARIYKWKIEGGPKAEDAEIISNWLQNGGKLEEIPREKKIQDVQTMPVLEVLMQKLITLSDTTNRLLERQEKGLLEKVDRVDANLNVVVAQTEKIGVELESGRMVALMALSRLEKKPMDELIHEADNIKIDLLKARDELYTSSVKDRSSTGKEK